MVQENGHVYVSGNSPVDDKNDDNIRVFRDELSRHLIDEALRQHPDAISFCFEAPIDSVDFERQLVSVAGQGQVLVPPCQLFHAFLPTPCTRRPGISANCLHNVHHAAFADLQQAKSIAHRS